MLEDEEDVDEGETEDLLPPCCDAVVDEEVVELDVLPNRSPKTFSALLPKMLSLLFELALLELLEPSELVDVVSEEDGELFPSPEVDEEGVPVEEALCEVVVANPVEVAEDVEEDEWVDEWVEVDAADVELDEEVCVSELDSSPEESLEGSE